MLIKIKDFHFKIEFMAGFGTHLINGGPFVHNNQVFAFQVINMKGFAFA